MTARDPRLDPLTAAARKIHLENNYDPHYSGVDARSLIETKLWLGRYDALQTLLENSPEMRCRKPDKIIFPIPMILFCPACGTQHIDAPKGEWTNPPHKSHLCAACDHIWRPANVPTAGVAVIIDLGSGDTLPPIRGRACQQRSGGK